MAIVGLKVRRSRERLSDPQYSDRAGQPAIEAQVLAGHVGRVLRRQVGDQCRKLLLLAVAAHRDTGPPVFFLRQAVDEARQDVVHAHIVGRILVGKQLGESSIRLIDAPVSGGRKKAALGILMVMAGGSAADLKTAGTLLACFGTVAHVGPLAAGHAMKALNNYVSAAGLLASMQALATAELFGIAPETFTKVINGSTGRNNTTEVKLEPFIISRRYDSGFFLRLMAKDVGIASSLIKNAGFDAPITTALNEYLESAVDHLGEDADHTGLYEMVNPAKSQKHHI